MSGTQGATVVNTVGGATASNVSAVTAMVLAATNNDTGSTLVARDGSGKFSTNMITIDGTTTNPTDVATKSYVDAATTTGIVPIEPAIVVSTVQTTLSGLQTIDSVLLVDSDRVLLVNQTSSIQNGVWLAHSGSWTRPTDFATGNTVGRAYVLVAEGVNNGGASWLCSTPIAIIDTDPISFSQFSLPGTETGNNVGTGTGMVFQSKTGNLLNFKTILASTHLTATNNSNDITLSTDATSTNSPLTIVARDATGTFAGALTGAASSNVLKTGDTMSGTLVMSNQNVIRFCDGGSNYVSIGAPAAVSSSYAVSLPSVAPTNNQKLIVDPVDATRLIWASGNSGSPPSATGSVFVSVVGDDVNGNGSLDFPYQTLAKALTVANSLSTTTTPITISLSPGIYTEDNSSGALSLTANGISIVGSTGFAVVIQPNTLSNTLLSVNATSWFSNVQFSTNGSSTADGLDISGATAQVVFKNVYFSRFNVGLRGSSALLLIIENSFFTYCGTGIYLDNLQVSMNDCLFQDGGFGTGLYVTGGSALVGFSSGLFNGLAIGVSVNNNATIAMDGTIFKNTATGCYVGSAGTLNLTGPVFNINNSVGDVIGIYATDAGTLFQCSSALFVNPTMPTNNQIAIQVVNEANVSFAGGEVSNYTTAFIVGSNTDTSATSLLMKAITVGNCNTDVVQNGTTTLLVQNSNIASDKITINDATNVTLSYFDVAFGDCLCIGKFSNAYNDIDLLVSEIGQGDNNPHLDYWNNMYGTQTIRYHNKTSSPSLFSSVGNNTIGFASVTTDRTQPSSLQLFSDTGATVGTTTSLRGWTIQKNGSSSELSFSFQNSDLTGALSVPSYTLLQLDGFNNLLQIPNSSTKITIAGDTNLYRALANVLQTDGNLIVGGLNANTVVVTNGSKQLTSSSTTSTEVGYLSGVTSSIQTQLNGLLSKSGGTLTGILQLPAGTTSLPSLCFTGSTTTGLSANSNVLSFSTNGNQVISINATGVVQINGLNALGIVHTDSNGNLSTTLIVNADISASAAIADSKLATITSAGKVANSALPTALTGQTYNGLTNTANSVGFSIAGGSTSKTFTVSNTLTIAGTDSSTINVGNGGTLVASAFTDTTSASNINSGILGVLYGGTGQSSYVNGQLLIGNSVGNTLTKGTLLSSDSSVTVVNGNGTISLTVSATNIVSGTLSNSRLPTVLSGQTYNGLSLTSNGVGFSIAGGTISKTLTINNTLGFSGTDGSTVNVGNGGTLVASAFTDTTNASNISSGTLSNSRLPTSLSGQTYNGLTNTALSTGFSIAGGTTSKTLTVSNTLSLSGTDGSTLNVGNGGTLVSSAFTDTTNASNINSGTLSVSYGGTGQSSFTNGQLLIGNSTGNTLAKATLSSS